MISEPKIHNRNEINDNLFCPRAIITTLTYHTNDIFGATRNIKDIRYGRKVQTELAKELCQKHGDL